MKLTLRAVGIAGLVLLVGVLVVGANANNDSRKAITPQSRENPLRELISGYYFNELELRSLQDDDFDNPGYPAVTQGEQLWNQPDGALRKSCASCHAAVAVRGRAAIYPKYDEEVGRLVTLEQRINICRQEKMNATPWPHESEALLAITTFVRTLARQTSTNVSIDGPAAPFFASGQSTYYTPTGQYGMTCAHCHNDHYGKSLRGDTISQGHPNGYPAYRVSAKKLTSLHSRLRDCFLLMRAEPYELGSAEFNALELYLNWRANGLPIETPAVRR